MLRINDTIWLEVITEEKIPTDTKQEESKNKPVYEPHVAPMSIFPLGAPNW